ncbi:DUF6081 family protein [Gordonia shandongensis]|uniref:DUF6081 family protein n=1 Tax=Gordonia shandongensis TaxID=376351 RepID=UPI00146BC4A1|nr:DUF6081 family protein [Gordonia shandongensis]
MSDSLVGPDLDDADWHFLEYPMGDDPAWVCREPSATVSVADGACTVEMTRFELTHPVQPIDNCKFVALSRREFEVPAAGTITVTGELSATQVGPADDYRDGFAALVVLDPVGGLVFDIAATGAQVMAIHERLPMGPDGAFTRVVDAPLAGVETGLGAVHHCAITLDRGAGSARWEVDGIELHDAHRIAVPDRFVVGMGVFTLVPTGGVAGASTRGQGLRATWANLAVTSATAA